MPPSIAELPWLPETPKDFAARCRALGNSDKRVGPEIQFLAEHRLSARQSLALSRGLSRCRAESRDCSPLAAFKLGILASGTYDLLLDCLPAAAARHGVALDVVTAPYDQVMQQALDPRSEVNTARTDAVLVAVDYRWLHLDRPSLAGASGDLVTEANQRLRSIVESLRANGNATTILETLPVPPQSIFGSLDRRVRGTVRAMIGEANHSIEVIAEETGSYLLDVAALAERVGTDQWFDPVQWAAYKFPFSASCFPIYADVVGRLLGSIRGKARKCLVLDLDNTIWGGVIGDDGLGGISIGQGNARGEAFLAVQQAAVDLRERGVVLAVCSKNDDAVARTPFREHPEMLLREDHIAVFQANWIDKPSNLEAIAQTLNIGLDSLVFLDDNPAERAQVRAALPMVAVPELPDDPSWYAWYLSSAGYFEAVAFSTEDRLRAESYMADSRRAEVMAKSRSLGDYLESLKMVIRFTPFDDNGRQRISQLINKTNQFNLTTRRYTEREVATMEVDASVFTLQVRLADKFSDLGMIGVVICRQNEGALLEWEIDTWLMSCRVLGRQVEQAMLAKITAEGTKRGIKCLIGKYFPTAKNGMVADHYKKLGFTQVEDSEAAGTTWKLDICSYAEPDLPMVFEDGFTSGDHPNCHVEAPPDYGAMLPEESADSRGPVAISARPSVNA